MHQSGSECYEKLHVLATGIDVRKMHAIGVSAVLEQESNTVAALGRGQSH